VRRRPGQLQRDGDALAFAAPPLRKSGPLPEDDVALIARGLGIAARRHRGARLVRQRPQLARRAAASAEQVLALEPDAAILAGLDVGVVGPRGKVGVVGAARRRRCAFEVRAFFPGNNGMAEDPVTGSLNAALAQWLIGAGWRRALHRAARARPGPRRPRARGARRSGEIWIGGASVTCIDGTVAL
jgi:predicted PhzF superfamily epimerase YddE/YHI9